MDRQHETKHILQKLSSPKMCNALVPCIKYGLFTLSC